MYKITCCQKRQKVFNCNRDCKKQYGANTRVMNLRGTNGKYLQKVLHSQNSYFKETATVHTVAAQDT
jgi:hypothetical protein